MRHSLNLLLYTRIRINVVPELSTTAMRDDFSKLLQSSVYFKQITTNANFFKENWTYDMLLIQTNVYVFV